MVKVWCALLCSCHRVVEVWPGITLSADTNTTAGTGGLGPRFGGGPPPGFVSAAAANGAKGLASPALAVAGERGSVFEQLLTARAKRLIRPSATAIFVLMHASV
jgi:hypothetical protein